MHRPIIFDVETQYSFQEVGNDIRKLKVSVIGMYAYETNTFQTYREKDLPTFFSKLEHASYLIGFNIHKFDLPVLSPYYVGDITQFPTLDLLEEVEKKLGHRLSLDDIAKATLGTQKTGHGFMAIDYFHKGEWEKLEEYCLSDVRITKELYEYMKANRKFYFNTPTGKKEVPIILKEKEEEPTTVSLSLPF